MGCIYCRLNRKSIKRFTIWSSAKIKYVEILGKKETIVKKQQTSNEK
jgi:hypothetical protein